MRRSRRCGRSPPAPDGAQRSRRAHGPFRALARLARVAASATARRTDALTEQQLALGRALEQVTTWLRRTRSATDLSPTGVSTLDRLAASGPARITDLAAREGVSQPGITTLVHRLVERGWAVREPDPADGRATLVRITDAGRERITAYRARRAEEIAERMDALAPEDQALLLAALPALAQLTDLDRRP